MYRVQTLKDKEYMVKKYHSFRDLFKHELTKQNSADITRLSS